VKLLIDVPDRWDILTAHHRRSGMKTSVYEQIQARKVKARQYQSNLPFFRGVQGVLLHMEEAL
jgi:hypothetical protein